MNSSTSKLTELQKQAENCAENDLLKNCKDCPFNHYGWGYCQTRLLKAICEALISTKEETET